MAGIRRVPDTCEICNTEKTATSILDEETGTAMVWVCDRCKKNEENKKITGTYKAARVPT